MHIHMYIGKERNIWFQVKMILHLEKKKSGSRCEAVPANCDEGSICISRVGTEGGKRFIIEMLLHLKILDIVDFIRSFF